jgi:hypothetical protein
MSRMNISDSDDVVRAAALSSYSKEAADEAIAILLGIKKKVEKYEKGI